MASEEHDIADHDIADPHFLEEVVEVESEEDEEDLGDEPEAGFLGFFLGMAFLTGSLSESISAFLSLLRLLLVFFDLFFPVS